ncbi:MAG TPA: protein translocase subunit SecD [Gemmatimonadales bacterium]|nr:protein translocase subunit SecD [Gemmatimonadales bacterium]
MNSIRSRLIITGILFVLAVASIIPRNEKVRVRDATTGQMKDTVTRRVPIHLGLDLSGGIHLALEVDQSKGPVADPADAIQRALRPVRARLDEVYGGEETVQLVGTSRLLVDLPGESDNARAKQLVQENAFLEFRIVDMKNLFRAALPQIDEALKHAGVKAPGAAPVAAVQQLFGQDTTKKGKAAKDTAALNTPGILASIVVPGQIPGEFYVPEEQVPLVDSLLKLPDAARAMPRGIEIRWSSEVESRGAKAYRAFYAVEDKPIITGEELEKATARRDQLTNQSVVDFVLSRHGGRIFSEQTGRHVNDFMAIILDGRVQGQPPVIRGQIGSHGQIELGAKPLAEANDLALVLRAGALPAPLTIVDEEALTPSLGSDSIRHGVTAGLVGVALVIVIMIGYYRLSGVLAVAALGFYVVFTLAGLTAFGFTLTLPGMAGFALSVAIAVDANVLIFERIREELQHGKSVRLSVDEGFKHAMSAIVDSNVATALTAFILYLVGTGPVQGFAISLLIGIGASMITAVFVVRTFYMIWLRQRPTMTSLSV